MLLVLFRACMARVHIYTSSLILVFSYSPNKKKEMKKKEINDLHGIDH